MVLGFFNRILRINLQSKQFQVQNIEDDIYKKCLSGKGLCTYLLLKMNPPQIDPFSDDNCIIFSPGFLAGTKIWGSTRYGVYTKSPLTGIFSEAYSGGTVSHHMSKTGYDAIVIEKKSNVPIFLEISDDFVKFHDATNLWGKNTYDSEREILAQINMKEAGAVVIGPAGENLVRFALISNDNWRCAGRTGVGAILGSKKVKGIIFHGKARKELANEELVRRFNKDLLESGKKNPIVKLYQKYGTPMSISILNTMDALPTQYWSKGTCPHADKISADALLEKMSVKPKACKFCFIACANMSEVMSGKRKGLKIEGPEYETIYAFGALCMVDNLEDIMYLNDLCDQFGIDTITGGNLCAFAIEASRRGAIGEKMSYGDTEAIAQILKNIVQRKSYGDILANGIQYASKKWDMEDIAIHVKGLEPAGVDPRVLKGMGLSYAVSVRGACHLRATFYKAELSGMIDPDQMEGKAKLYIEFEDKLNLYDSLILCKYYRDLIHWDEIRTIIEATTGLRLSVEDLRIIAAGVQNLVHEFNKREGLTRADDKLPKRFFEQKLPKSGKYIDEKDFNKMVDEYWQLRGWTS